MGDSAYNVLGLPDLEVVSQHYETRKHQDGYPYDIIVYTVKHLGYVPYCHACQEATGETCIAQKHEKSIRYIKDLDTNKSGSPCEGSFYILLPQIQAAIFVHIAICLFPQ